MEFAQPAPKHNYPEKSRTELSTEVGKLVDALMLATGDWAAANVETREGGQDNTIWVEEINRMVERHCGEMMRYIWD